MSGAFPRFNTNALARIESSPLNDQIGRLLAIATERMLSFLSIHTDQEGPPIGNVLVCDPQQINTDQGGGTMETSSDNFPQHEPGYTRIGIVNMKVIGVMIENVPHDQKGTQYIHHI